MINAKQNNNYGRLKAIILIHCLMKLHIQDFLI